MATRQDYIARIRYSNALPPPPDPPKLLDMPGTGLAGGQYTSAGYASRLAREQPLNIEGDAELGMPIDLVGIPGIFEGNEQAIMARSGPHNMHPADKALLRPLASLGKVNAGAGAVSFLRRTEYTQNAQHFSSSTSRDLVKLRNDGTQKKLSANKDDPINIMRNIIKGFDIAYPSDAFKGEDSTTSLRGAQITDAEVKAWSAPKHPTKPDLKLLDSYPVLPDLEAIPSTGFYMVMKFNSAPVPTSESYDGRLDNAILQPILDPVAEAAFQQKTRDWHENPSNKPRPIQEYDYEYFLSADPAAVHSIKRKFDVNDPEHDDAELYTDDFGDSQRCFKFARLRTYETYSQTGDPNNFYNDSIALALHDPETEVGAVKGVRKRLRKGAYFYPIVQRTSLRPKRHVGRAALSQQDEQKYDDLNITVVDPSEDVQAAQIEKRMAVEAGTNTAEAAG